jgi:predicted component of type VI protein secretion system
MEAARLLAERMVKREDLSPSERVAWAFRLVTSRPPSPRELELLTSDLADYRRDYERQPEAAKELLAVGEKPFDATLNAIELAAYTLVANTIMNFDESITQN